MKTRKLRIGASLCALAQLASLAFGEVIYENDFSTRRSTDAIPTGKWYELTYHTGQLAYNYEKNWQGEDTPYKFPTAIQDGWALANIGKNNAMYTMGQPVISTNPLSQVPDGDATNQFMALYASDTPRSCMATHPLYNSFTSGVLRISADMRAPDFSPGGESSTYVRVMPLCRAQMNSLNWITTAYTTTVAFAMHYAPEYGGFIPFLFCGNGSGGAAGDYMKYSKVARLSWCRLVAEIDLDAKTVSCEAYNLGTGNPTSETTGTLISRKTGKPFYRPVTDESGPITGIGVFYYRTFAQQGVATNAICVDNLSVAWKAPGTQTFESCYENDFNVRRYRTLAPSGTTATPYVFDDPVNDDVYSDYIADKQVVPDADVSLKNKKPQPLGIDNWRRINDDGTGTAMVVDSGDSNFGMAMRMTANSQFICITQPLGQTIADGKVRMEADMRLPDKWHWSAARSAQIDLGTKSFASTLYYYFSTNRIGGAGIGGNSEEAFYPTYAGNGGTQRATSVNCVAQSWYRIVLTADIGGQKYDYALYQIANGVPGASPVFSAADVAFNRYLSSIGSFALLAYAPGNTTSTAVLFDNISVWKNAGTAQEALIYSNDFSTRTRHVETPRLPIATAIDRIDSGADNWVRRNNSLASTFIQGTANPALAFVGPTSHAYLLHPFGRTMTFGKVRASVDIRPASNWQWVTAREATFYLGDDMFLQGNKSNADPFTSHLIAGAGVKAASASANTFGLYTGAKPFATSGSSSQNGTAFDSTHWYRFRVTAPLDSSTYSVKVYDMGTEHPEPSTPEGSLVEQFNDLPYRNGKPASGISCFALAGYGTAGFSAWEEECPDAALFDNVQIEYVPSGLKIIMR